MATLPFGAQLIILIAPILLLCGWLLCLKISARTQTTLTRSVSDEEWEAAWRNQIADTMESTIWGLPIAAFHLGFVHLALQKPLITGAFAAAYVVIHLLRLRAASAQIRMGWHQAKSTKWAENVRLHVSRKTTKNYSPDERFGDNGEVLN